jgi:hypothetical protein
MRLIISAKEHVLSLVCSYLKYFTLKPIVLYSSKLHMENHY